MNSPAFCRIGPHIELAIKRLRWPAKAVSRLACEPRLPEHKTPYNYVKIHQSSIHPTRITAGHDALALLSPDISITIAPPALAVYDQPLCPGDGYIWIPGYWAYGEDDYYWVPGVWILAPQPGFLWTPGYWGFEGGHYGWHAGYWGSCTSASTAVLTMGSVISDPVSSGADGKVTDFSVTPPFGM